MPAISSRLSVPTQVTTTETRHEERSAAGTVATAHVAIPPAMKGDRDEQLDVKVQRAGDKTWVSLQLGMYTYPAAAKAGSKQYQTEINGTLRLSLHVDSGRLTVERRASPYAPWATVATERLTALATAKDTTLRWNESHVEHATRQLSPAEIAQKRHETAVNVLRNSTEAKTHTLLYVDNVAMWAPTVGAGVNAARAQPVEEAAERILAAQEAQKNAGRPVTWLGLRAAGWITPEMDAAAREGRTMRAKDQAELQREVERHIGCDATPAERAAMLDVLHETKATHSVFTWSHIEETFERRRAAYTAANVTTPTHPVDK